KVRPITRERQGDRVQPVRLAENIHLVDAAGDEAHAEHELVPHGVELGELRPETDPERGPRADGPDDVEIPAPGAADEDARQRAPLTEQPRAQRIPRAEEPGLSEVRRE